MNTQVREIEDLGEGIKRQILAYNKDIMAVKVWFDKGAIGYAHKHHHTQITYVEEGEFIFTIAGKERILKSGDSCIIPPNVEHGTTTTTGGLLIDTFSPMREDFSHFI